LPAGPAVGPVHLDHGDLVGPQEPAQLGSEGTGAFDADGHDLAM
jgi:hypothetical protein